MDYIDYLFLLNNKEIADLLENSSNDIVLLKLTDYYCSTANHQCLTYVESFNKNPNIKKSFLLTKLDLIKESKCFFKGIHTISHPLINAKELDEIFEKIKGDKLHEDFFYFFACLNPNFDLDKVPSKTITYTTSFWKHPNIEKYPHFISLIESMDISSAKELASNKYLKEETLQRIYDVFSVAKPVLRKLLANPRTPMNIINKIVEKYNVDVVSFVHSNHIENLNRLDILYKDWTTSDNLHYLIYFYHNIVKSRDKLMIKEFSERLLCSDISDVISTINDKAILSHCYTGYESNIIDNPYIPNELLMKLTEHSEDTIKNKAKAIIMYRWGNFN